jgi:hypothetical protein
MKFSTTLLKVAPLCKISKLDFLIGQKDHSRGPNLVNTCGRAIWSFWST